LRRTDSSSASEVFSVGSEIWLSWTAALAL
jgi:hypothetical protein